MATTNTSIMLMNTEKNMEAGATYMLLAIKISEIKLNTIM